MTSTIARLISAIAVAALLAVSAPSPAAGVAGFGDVHDDRFYTVPVQWMVDEGITTGVSPSCFDPDGTVTRGQGITFLWRYAGEPSAPAHSFRDVTAGWMDDAVDWGEDRGITAGMAPGLFAPDLPLSRAQFVTMLWRLSGRPAPNAAPPFVDLPQSWYRDPVAWASEDGVTGGVGDGRFAPDRSLTRGELATMLFRFADPNPPSVDPDSPPCWVSGPAGPWTASVDLPRGHLGPVTSTPIDPETVGIRWDGNRYVVPGGFVWSETARGGFLHFTKGRVVINGDGVVLDGFVLSGIQSGNDPVLKAGTNVGPFVIRHWRSIGGKGSAVIDSSPGRGEGSVVSNFEIVAFDGDGLKPPVGSTFTDGRIGIRSGAGSGKHYDGVQITGRSGVTLQRLRISMEGSTDVNAAIFVHDFNGTRSENTTITDIDVANAAHSWYPIRLKSGSVVLRDVVGRGPMAVHAKQPSAFIWHEGQSGIDWRTVWVAFDGPVDVQFS